ncbi:hypothetical protein H5410_009794 [Solanum commersonii]|uniref:Uncharacterized protein n=1 Tax=Solanum commersonii TaxID=4109 RepID=A0A9J6AIY1_SOLCO|nr:hypothetical protein H5410_009794 [Solanum commersonii]
METQGNQTIKPHDPFIHCIFSISTNVGDDTLAASNIVVKHAYSIPYLWVRSIKRKRVGVGIIKLAEPTNTNQFLHINLSITFSPFLKQTYQST